jgi:hypothetical protein
MLLKDKLIGKAGRKEVRKEARDGVLFVIIVVLMAMIGVGALVQVSQPLFV